MVIMVEGDDTTLDWVTADPTDPNLVGQMVLNHLTNGDCVYLGPDGCTIHGRHPAICRTFDCAGFVRMLDSKRFEHVGPKINNAVTRAGRRRLAGKRP